VIALIDYGAGNLRSVVAALEACGSRVNVVRDADALSTARAIVIPGVGHFAATHTLDDGWKTALRSRLEDGAHVLGICLGMQWLFDASEEAPAVPGFGAFAGTCRRLTASDGLKVPHVGWNTLAAARPSRLLEGIDAGAAVYFTHTYAAPITADARACTTHGEAFAAVVERDRVAGVQFHPEKSGRVGLALLRNFLAMTGPASC
jgi:glutamine amidotransferase